MGLIFDTSLLIAAERGLLDIDGFIKGKEEELFGISVVTVSELLHGVYRADTEKRRLKREAYVENVIEVFPIYHFDTSSARIYARIWSNLASKSTQVGAHDLIIASTAISLGFSVATFDKRDYMKIEGLNIELLGSNH
jgi:tRNA(fMet)-specific endonuclease VapC